MKIESSTIALLAVSLSGADAGFLRGKNNNACTPNYDPVACIKEENGVIETVIFTNLCEATQAGFPEEKCMKQERALESADTGCKKIYEPVECENVIFPNLCEAKKAGFPEEKCTRQEERGESGSAETGCAKVYEPVKCGNRIFRNLCEGMKAGYPEESCTSHEERTQSGGSADTGCEKIYDPVQCLKHENGVIHDVIFPNMCEAAKAGFREEDCKKENEDREEEACVGIFDPLGCSREVGGGVSVGEVFNNLCEALKAGYSEEDCSRGETPEADIDCTTEYDPVMCEKNDNGIIVTGVFSNRCEARLEGFEEEHCEPADPSDEEKCPTVYDPVACRREENGVIVEYVFSNKCEAAELGFSEEDCI